MDQLQALVTGAIAASLTSVEHLELDVELRVDEHGLYLPQVWVTGRITGTELVVEVKVLGEEDEELLAEARTVMRDKRVIEELNFLGSRAYGLLKRNGVSTIGDLLALSEADLRDLYGMGTATLSDILAALSEQGLELRSKRTRLSEQEAP